VVGETTVTLAVSGDRAAEAQRLGAELRKKQQEIQFIEGKLQNPDFTGRAPEAVVRREKDRLKEAKEAALRLQRLLGD
jgi:valyl-tRNA synthetase